MGSHGNRLSGISTARFRRALTKTARIALPALLFLPATPLMAQDCLTGVFVAEAGPDTASMLEIKPDGSFRYMLSEGAVDEAAEGKWTCSGGTLRLTTLPTPKAAEYRLEKVTDGEKAPFALIVKWPNGQGAAAIDFRLDMDKGEPITDYTQDYGWSRDLDGRMPVSIQLSEPFFGTVSPVFSLPQRSHIRVHILFIPNDLGIANFRDVLVTQAAGKLSLHWRERSILYSRAQDD